MKKYDIKTTDPETLKKWYHLMIELYGIYRF